MTGRTTLAVLAAMLLPAAGWTLASEGPADSLQLAMFSEEAADPPATIAADPNTTCCAQEPYCQCCTGPDWEVGVDFLMMQRFGGRSRTLLADRVTHVEALSSDDFHFGMEGGPRVSLVRHGCQGYDLEFVYFGINGWSSSCDVPQNPNRYEIRSRTATYLTSQGPFHVDYATRLYNGELNLNWNPTSNVKMLAGFRWDELAERIDGFNVSNINDGMLRTTNDLFGFQVGTDITFWESCRFGIDGIVKAGIYGNRATAAYVESGTRAAFYRVEATDVAFVGEAGLEAHYQITCDWTARIGYQLLWLEGVATAPDQVAGFDIDHPSIISDGAAWYHGFNMGVEYRF